MPKTKVPASSAPTPQRDPFIFKYLKFACQDVKKTQEFYQLLGMNLDWQVRQQVELPTSSKSGEKKPTAKNQEKQEASKQTSQPPGAGVKPTEFKADVAAAPESGSEEVKAADATFKTTFSMSFQVPSGEVNDQTFQLFFEHMEGGPSDSSLESEKDMKIAVMDKVGAADRANSNAMKIHGGKVSGVQKGAATRNGEYLVIYVHFLSRLIKRLQAKGVEIIVQPTDFFDMKIAVVRDPNTLEVRLAELSDLQLEENPAAKKQWFAKLGYYTLPINQSDIVVRSYERFFSYAAVVEGKGQKKGMGDGRSKFGRGKKPGTAVDQSFNLQGFRLVDSEEFAIDSIIKRWEWDKANEVQWETGRVRISGIGQYCCFREKTSTIPIELFNPRSLEPADNIKDGETNAVQNSNKIRRHVFEHLSESRTSSRGMEIDTNYLKGQAKVLSEGAINLRSLPTSQPSPKPNNGEAFKTSREGGSNQSIGDMGQQQPKTIKFKMQRARRPSDDANGEVESRTGSPRKGDRITTADRAKSASMKW
ncbi:hypothetical protein HDU67_004118 [Dinochytrium kinnereticum]|nr:hypothetical protein HDU67_004118 [Dinochytrium kinnereticum]